MSLIMICSVGLVSAILLMFVLASLESGKWKGKFMLIESSKAFLLFIVSGCGTILIVNWLWLLVKLLFTPWT